LVYQQLESGTRLENTGHDLPGTYQATKCLLII
jgi:hypothetical protein